MNIFHLHHGNKTFETVHESNEFDKIHESNKSESSLWYFGWGNTFMLQFFSKMP